MPTVSCIICAYNEALRLPNVLDVVAGHPDLLEVIVVDDGSSDGAAQVVERYPQVRLITLARNCGKSVAMAEGVNAAIGDYLLFMDADLEGVAPEDIHRLAAPVKAGQADVAMGLLGNSLAIYRWIGLDFITGERLIPAWLARRELSRLRGLPRWGAEVFLNDRVIEAGLSVAVVGLPKVRHASKAEKLGLRQGLSGEMQMTRQVLGLRNPWELARQVVQLRALVATGAASAR